MHGLVPQVSVNLRTMDSFVATGRPTSALRQTSGVIRIANQDPARRGLLLEMALQAQRGIAFREHALIDRAVRRMAGSAALFGSFVVEDKRTALREVALETGSVLAQEGDAATFNILDETRAAAFDDIALVRVMAIGTAHLAFRHRMMMRELEAGANISVALEAGIRIATWIDNAHMSAPGLHMQAGRTLT